ncbi:MAG: hypothetical protein HYX53_00600 [Chloroflexi bacterium]|nr:hypothetical protein [Chloroflexota bacterium]
MNAPSDRRTSVQKKWLGLVAAFALLLGLAGFGAANTSFAQSTPTATATGSAVAGVQAPSITPAAPSTGTGTTDSSSAVPVSLVVLGVAVLGGGIVLAAMSRRPN